MRVRDVLADRDDFGKLERTLTSIIGIVRSLDESVLADTLFVHLEMTKSLSTRLDWLKNRGRDVLEAELVDSYALTRERDQVDWSFRLRARPLVWNKCPGK